MSAEEREENILHINANQEEKLSQKGVTIVNGENENEYHRKLIAYYRPTQIDYISRQQVQAIMHFLKYFVENGYSQIFDQFLVSYRFPERDMLNDFSQNSLLATGYDFRNISSIYANTIHFSNGSPDFIPGTRHILADTPHNRWKHKQGKKYTHLPLNFQTISSETGSHIRMPSDLEKKQAHKLLLPNKIEPILNTVVKTINTTEQIMLGK